QNILNALFNIVISFGIYNIPIEAGRLKVICSIAFRLQTLLSFCAFTSRNLWASNPILSKGRLQKQRKILTGTMKNLSVWKRHYGNFILNKPVIYLSLPFITPS